MPPTEEPPVETLEPAAPSVNALPESVAAVVKKADFESIADQFHPKETPPIEKKDETIVPETVVEKKPVTLAEKIAARAAKPKVKAEGETIVPPKEEPAVNPEDKLELDAKSSTVARENFKVLKGITKGVRDQLITKDREVSDLRTKLEAATKAPTTVDAAKLTRLEAEHKALSDRLLLIDTQNHPTYQAQFVAPKNQALQAAKELLPAEKAGDLNKLMSLPRSELGKAVSELTKDLPDIDRADASQSILAAWKLEQAGSEALKNAGATYQNIRQKTETEQKQIFGQRWQSVAQEERIELLEVPADADAETRTDIEAYNADAAAVQTRAEQIALGKVGETDVADFAIKASAYDFHVKRVLPRIGREIGQMQVVINRLTKELEGYRSRNPRRDITHIPGVDNRPPPAKVDSIEAAADAHFGKSK